MRRGGWKGQTQGKGYFLKAVINGILKQELWIDDRHEGLRQSHLGRHKDTKVRVCSGRLRTSACICESGSVK